MAESEETGSDRPFPWSAPVTSLIALAWVVLFVMLAMSRGDQAPPRAFLYGSFITSQISHGFGDVTPLGIYGGQFWRAITATFVHFNALHLALNLIAFVQLGRVVESWYGSSQFVAIYVVLGAGANLIANLLRPWMSGASTLIVHSGGGSTVVLGLIGLVAVVGWRNPSEFPRKAPLWMALVLLANAVLGMVIPNIDNLGHAAGAAVGGLVGLLDRRMIRWAPTPKAWLIGASALLVLVGSGFAQVRHRQAEQKLADDVAHWGTMVQDLSKLSIIYRELAARGLNPRLVLRPGDPNLLGAPALIVPEPPVVGEMLKGALLGLLRQLDSHAGQWDQGASAETYQTVRQLSARALFKPPTSEEIQLFEQSISGLLQPTLTSWVTARSELNLLQRPEPRFAGQALNRLVLRAGPRRVGGEAVPAAPSAPSQSPPSSESAPETP